MKPVTLLSSLALLVAGSSFAPHSLADEGNARHPLPIRKQSPQQWLEQKREQQQPNVHRNKPKAAPMLSALNSNSLVAGGCANVSELLPLTGDALVNAVANGDLVNCLYKLYDTSLVGSGHFTDSKLQTIVDAIASRMNQLAQGDSIAAELEKLVTYLRAVHWAETSANSNRSFTANYSQTLRLAFDRYFASSQFVSFTGNGNRHFMLRYEMMVLVNSSNSLKMTDLKRFSEALLGYANSVSRSNDWGVYYEENGVTQLLTQFFNAMVYRPDAYQAQLQAQPQIIDNLIQFIRQDGLWLVDHTRQYQWADSISELGRLLKFGGSIADKVRPTMQYLLSHYQFAGSGSAGWVNAQRMVKEYDNARCGEYGDACQFDLESAVLSGHHTCSSTIKIRFQEPISTANLAATCAQLTEQEGYFKQVFANPAPVANDQNTDLEVVVFSSANDYQSYAGTFFDISTDNGGMYLEGTPFTAGNQARFIAYQATWLPGFEIWNLRHEYNHYLDGRFNQWGGFGDQAANSVWWGEGVAEYLAQRNDNPKAMAVAPNKTYQFSDLLQTTYANSNTERTYYWGYLAVRFMFERHRDLLDQQLLPSMRAAKYVLSDEPCSFDWGWQRKADAEANNWFWLYDDSDSASGNWVWTCGQAKPSNPQPLPSYTKYADIIADWTPRFNGEFHEWLDCVVTGEDCSATTTGPQVLSNGQSVPLSGARASEQHFKLQLPTNASNIVVQSSGGSGDVDLYLKVGEAASLSNWDVRPYLTGNNETLKLASASGDVYVMAYGYADFSNATLHVSWQENSYSELKNWADINANQSWYQWLWVPANAKALRFNLTGNGDAKLYVKSGTWPTTSSYDAAATTANTATQSVTIDAAKAGTYYHIMLTSSQGLSNGKLTVSMAE